MLLSEKLLRQSWTILPLAVVTSLVMSNGLQAAFAADSPAKGGAETKPVTPPPPVVEEEEEEEEDPAPVKAAPLPPVEPPPVAPVPAKPLTPEDEAKIKEFRGDYHFTKGDKLYKSGDYLKAAVECREALKYQPQNIKYAQRWAEAADKSRNWPLAVEANEALLKLDPTRKQLLKDIGDYLFYQKQFDAACEKYKQAAAFVPEKGDLWRKVAKTKMQLGENEESILAYRQATKVEPRDGRAWVALATMLASQGRADEAFAVYRDGVRNAPKDGDLQEGYAYALMGRKEYHGALEAYRQAALCKGSTAAINQGFQAAQQAIQYEEQQAQQRAALEAKKKKKK